MNPMTDDDFVRACILADEVRDLRLKYEGIDDMNATDRLKLAAAMAYREGISESEIHAIVEAKLSQLEGRTVQSSDDAAGPKPNADQDVAACGACQHCERKDDAAKLGPFGWCVKLKGLIERGDDGRDCQAFERIAPGSRKIGLKGTAHGVARGKAGR
jgi:hypothetical protein